MNKSEREIAKEILKEKFANNYHHEEVQKWLFDRLENYVYNNYKYYARKMSYIQYITQLYLYGKVVKTIKVKYKKLLLNLKRIQEKLYQKEKNIVIKEGTRSWAAIHLPPPSTSSGSLMD